MANEMTKKCAEALGIEVFEFSNDAGTPPKLWCETRGGTGNQVYDPLNNDEQAMALQDWLIERGELFFGRNTMIYNLHAGGSFQYPAMNKKMRRHAIVECVSKMVKP